MLSKSCIQPSSNNLHNDKSQKQTKYADVTLLHTVIYQSFQGICNKFIQQTENTRNEADNYHKLKEFI